jgi:hypothetical protein
MKLSLNNHDFVENYVKIFISDSNFEQFKDGYGLLSA